MYFSQGETMNLFTRSAITIILLTVLTSCTAASNSCPLTEPEWLLAPDNPAINNSPAYGNYYVNEDLSIWASAWWTDSDEYQLTASEDGIKLGWFRPAGAELTITGLRLDAEVPALKAEIPCCYPTRFQATGLYFPMEGCWEVTAKAEDKSLSFVVMVKP